ncbi:MAG: vWA domain-containing protein [Rhodomicrobium sp.]
MAKAIAFDAVPGLQTQMVRFVRLLRGDGFSAGVSEIADAFRTLGRIDATDIHQVRSVLRTLFSSREREWHRFDEVFDAFWLGRARYLRTVAGQAAGAQAARQLNGRETPGTKRGTLADYFDWGARGSEAISAAVAGEGRVTGASPAETLAKADFGQVTDPEELQRLHALCERWAERIRYRLSRRRRAARKGERVLLRRTFQRSVSTGGMPLTLYRSRRKPKPVKIVIFVDVSGSMDLYSLFFTRFVYALSMNWAKTEAFIFHTRLVHITGTLMEANPMKLMEKMALISQGWSGGTRIGAALAEFNNRYAGKLMTSNTLAVIVSDGFDTGPSERLAAELARLKRRATRVVWLNPLLGRESYEPRAAGMAAALPHLDLFAPAHNLESLAALEDELALL